MTIDVRYSCAGCKLTEIHVDVPARESDEDVAAWMDRTIRVLAADHWRRSPRCTAKSLQEVKIPVGGAQHIGGPTVQ